MSKLEAAKNDVIERAGGVIKGKIECFTLDLGDYDSIDLFIKNVKAKFPKIDCLINNAGAITKEKYEASKYGLESTFQANFVSTVVLTENMIPLMADGGRIVNVSSMSHADASTQINWDAIPSDETTYGGYNKDYCESKWLLTAYSSSLNRRLAPRTLSMCADPGISPSSAMWDHQTALMRFMARYMFRFLTKTSPQAAACATHVAVMDDPQGGAQYHSGKLYPPMRADTEDPDEWTKAAAVLKKVLPKDLQWCAITG
jgi:retinol dehydrogenase-14